MKKRDATGKVLLVVMVLVISMNMFGCSDANKKVPEQNNQASTIQTTPKVELKKDPNAPDKDKLLSQELTSEKEVLGGQVYMQNDMVFATMLIKNEVKEEDAKKVAQKYADELKKKYTGKKINVQAVQNGRNVANITY